MALGLAVHGVLEPFDQVLEVRHARLQGKGDGASSGGRSR
jgi:hypothetical protein